MHCNQKAGCTSASRARIHAARQRCRWWSLNQAWQHVTTAKVETHPLAWPEQHMYIYMCSSTWARDDCQQNINTHSRQVTRILEQILTEQKQTRCQYRKEAAASDCNKQDLYKTTCKWPSSRFEKSDRRAKIQPPTAQKYNQPTKQVKQKRQTATGIGAWSFLVPLNSSRIASEKRQLRS